MRPLAFDEVRAMASTWRVLELVDWRVNYTQGKILRGPCPVHGSTWPRSRVFCAWFDYCFCHKCKWKGDVVDLMAQLSGKTKLEAAYAICALARREPPYL